MTYYALWLIVHTHPVYIPRVKALRYLLLGVWWTVLVGPVIILSILALAANFLWYFAIATPLVFITYKLFGVANLLAGNWTTGLHCFRQAIPCPDWQDIARVRDRIRKMDALKRGIK